MREYLDERVYSRQLLQDLTGIQVLAAVPKHAARTGRWKLLSGSVRGRRRDTNVDAGQQTASQIAAIRRLRDALFENRPQRGRSLLMASATLGEGRTTIALNLALTSAAAGWRVLLIDADIERGMLSKTLAAGGNAGLFDLVEGRATLSSVLLSDTESGLNFLPLGNATLPGSRNPNPQDFAQKLSEPANQFDLVIIDGGAVLEDEYVRPFAEFVDDIVFVVRSGGPKRDEVVTAIDGLRINARKVRGTVLTGAEAA